MEWNIRGNRILSDEELSREDDATILAIVLLGVPALACWGFYYFVGVASPWQKISIILVGFLSFVFALKFVRKIIFAIFLIIALSTIVFLAFCVMFWIFK